jgi:hypothetical protein
VGSGREMIPVVNSLFAFFRKNLIENLLIRRIVGMFFLSVFLIGYVIYGIQEGKKRAELRRANLSYITQVNELNRIESSLKYLIEFINPRNRRHSGKNERGS